LRKAIPLLLVMSLLVVAGLGCGSAPPAAGEEPAGEPEPVAEGEYPSRTIEYIVGWGAGGGSDVFARTINIPVRGALGVPIVEINMPGASSATATIHVMQQPADGYTVFGITPDLLTNHILGRCEFSHEDFTPIIRAHVDVGVIHTRAGAPFQTWEEFVKYAGANPGKVSWAGIGAASFDEIASAVIWNSAGLEVKYVPYESGGEMHAALLGGHIDVMYEEPGVVMSLIEEGKVQPLLVLTDSRIERFPDLPCAGEMGYEVPPAMWRGIAVKKGTPAEIVAALEKAYSAAIESSVYRDFEKNRVLDLYPGFMGSEEFRKDMEREYGLYYDIMKKLGHVQ